MKEDKTQPTDRMTSQPVCYHSDCGSTPKWGIASSVAARNPDGSPLTLFACDEHYSTLTNQMVEAKTKYTLFPINGPHFVGSDDWNLQGAPVPPQKSEPQAPTSLVGKILLCGACVVIGTIIAPFMLVYYAGKWAFGWRPAPVEDV